MLVQGTADIEMRQEGVLHDINMAHGHLMSHLFGINKLNV